MLIDKTNDKMEMSNGVRRVLIVFWLYIHVYGVNEVHRHFSAPAVKN